MLSCMRGILFFVLYLSAILSKSGSSSLASSSTNLPSAFFFFSRFISANLASSCKNLRSLMSLMSSFFLSCSLRKRSCSATSSDCNYIMNIINNKLHDMSFGFGLRDSCHTHTYLVNLTLQCLHFVLAL